MATFVIKDDHVEIITKGCDGKRQASVLEESDYKVPNTHKFNDKANGSAIIVNDPYYNSGYAYITSSQPVSTGGIYLTDETGNLLLNSKLTSVRKTERYITMRALARTFQKLCKKEK